MSRAGARAYNGCLESGDKAPSGGAGSKAPSEGTGGEAPPEADEVFVFKKR